MKTTVLFEGVVEGVDYRDVDTKYGLRTIAKVTFIDAETAGTDNERKFYLTHWLRTGEASGYMTGTAGVFVCNLVYKRRQSNMAVLAADKTTPFEYGTFEFEVVKFHDKYIQSMDGTNIENTKRITDSIDAFRGKKIDTLPRS